MNDRVSFEGIGEMMATFKAKNGVTAGQPVKLATDGQVGMCAVNDRFCGVALAPAGGFAAVQLAGFLSVKCEDATVTPGYCKLVADGTGGVKIGAAGSEYLVVATDFLASTVTICL